MFSMEDPVYRKAALDAVDVLLEKDRFFEINSGAISRGYRTAPYPAPVLLQHIRDLDFKVDSIENEPSGAVESDSRALLMTLKAKKPEDHVVLSERIKSIPGVVHIEEL